mmetsp:Transcript_29766/g.51718  ORF Transcript_29766/g.51718 Transcript_29766/m.51718 type:complete len:321 (-) Transcript_29766:25-987(-)
MKSAFAEEPFGAFPSYVHASPLAPMTAMLNGAAFPTPYPAVGSVYPPPPLPPTLASPLASTCASELQSREAQFAANYSSVWPPPPLPPVSCEITARIEALERQRNLSQELVRERDIELEATVAEWRAKVELLEARLRSEESAAARRAEEVEQRIREEMQLEVQGARDLARRLGAEDVERLRMELRQAEIVIQELRSEKETRSLDQRGQNSSSDVHRQIEVLIAERDRLASDLGHIKKANENRKQEAQNLRQSLMAEREANKLLISELESARADADVVKARAAPASFPGRRSNAFDGPPIEFNVDLTEDDVLPRRYTEIRR